MIIYVVDDEFAPLQLLGETIREVDPHASVELFQDPLALLRRAEDRPCDVAFLDVKMTNVDGMLLARKLKEGAFAKNIIFVTSYSEYALEALNMFASGYVLKPASAEDIRHQLNNLRVPVASVDTRIKVRTFGGFLVTVNDEPVKFKRQKSKEVLAYLIDQRGNDVYPEDIIEALWEGEPFDESRMKYLRVLISTLMRDLAAVGAEGMLVQVGTYPTIVEGSFWCDAYELEDGDPVIARSFKGNYLPQYPWGEITNARLSRIAGLI